MENKIDISKLLKDCPAGMELNCTTWENVTFEKVVGGAIYIKRNNKTPSFDNIVILNKYGCATNYEDEKCRIFPKGKTTWEGFHRPFKDGDILATNDGSFIAIIKKNGGKYYCCCHTNGNYFITDYSGWFDRFATEEEKQKLFEAIKTNGYKWNSITKTLEELPKFEDGDIVVAEDSESLQLFLLKHLNNTKNNNDYNGCCYFGWDFLNNRWFGKGNWGFDRLATEEEKQKLFDAIREKGYHWNTESKTLEKLVEPKFKIEKGKWYVCIKDLLDNYANKAFCKGDIYLSTQDGSLIPSNSNIPFEVFCPTTYFIPWTIQDAKDGDIITMGNEWGVHIFIYNNTTDKYNDHGYYAILTSRGNLKFNGFCNGKTYKLATEEEKAKLFQVVKDNGYRWNPETKTLERLPEFKVGDRIRHKDNGICCTLGEYSEGISAYRTNIGLSITHKDLEQWELVQNKFDIASLKPFDKVLVRNNSSETWHIQFFENYNRQYGAKYPFVCMCNKYSQCIPFKYNEHLVDTANNCDDYFKTWKDE